MELGAVVKKLIGKMGPDGRVDRFDAGERRDALQHFLAELVVRLGPPWQNQRRQTAGNYPPRIKL